MRFLLLGLVVGVGTLWLLTKRPRNPWVEAQLATLTEQKRKAWR